MGDGMAEGGLRAAAMEAWIYGLPLIEMAMTRQNRAGFGGAQNVFGHMRDLADHRMRAVTTPNNDTLYTSAQIDLTQGPVTITLPRSGERYLSLALMDAYTNNFAILGTRTTGPDGGTFRLIGPWDAAEPGDAIRSPTPWVWALARILVDGPDDLEAARAVQSGISLQGPPGPAIGQSFARRAAPWRDYFASLDALMTLNPPPATDRAILSRMAPLGVGAGFTPDRFSDAEVAEIEAGVADARVGFTRGAFGSVIDGWSYPRAELGDFGQNYAYRGLVAVAGLAALPPVEAMYIRAIGKGRGVFDGLRDWRLHFPAGELPPVEAFWSLSIYEATPDGQFFFAENPLGRYAIGDRTEGLEINEDGSLDIWIGSRRPARDSNWLPAPEGPFGLFFRAYFPKPALQDGSWRLRALEEVA
ncbi:DUF1254 domain-containing protein [Phenylobacterium sp.]|uniref:DUF1254 domain-containing protein n=1 Tax=Phenylobacterium sp. TaxID=1871053 RepID=UPI002735B76A|nr:DUF1254 domain-containing protein [Phenylobacterium sp.]MDP3856110.1 DUF1254 domain-containing protein [Phenylobacterium sp.]